MTIEKLIEKAREFEKKNERITWKPNDFPEDMSESSTLDLYQKVIICMML